MTREIGLAVVALLLASCETAPEPGELGWLDCQQIPLAAAGCRPLTACCEVVSEEPRDPQRCWLETKGGGVFECRGEDCSLATVHATCRVCDALADTPQCDGSVAEAPSGVPGVRPPGRPPGRPAGRP